MFCVTPMDKHLDKRALAYYRVLCIIDYSDVSFVDRHRTCTQHGACAKVHPPEVSHSQDTWNWKVG